MQICIIHEDNVFFLFVLYMYVYESSCMRSPLRKTESKKKDKDSSLCRKMLVSMVTLSMCWCVWWPHAYSPHMPPPPPPLSRWRQCDCLHTAHGVIMWCSHVVWSHDGGPWEKAAWKTWEIHMTKSFSTSAMCLRRWQVWCAQGRCFHSLAYLCFLCIDQHGNLCEILIGGRLYLEF